MGDNEVTCSGHAQYCEWRWVTGKQ